MTMHTSAMKLSSTKWRNRFRLNTVHRWFVLFSLHLLLIIWFIQCFTSDLVFSHSLSFNQRLFLYFSFRSVYLTQLRCFRFISILFRSVKFFLYICIHINITYAWIIRSLYVLLWQLTHRNERKRERGDDYEKEENEARNEKKEEGEGEGESRSDAMWRRKTELIVSYQTICLVAVVIVVIVIVIHLFICLVALSFVCLFVLVSFLAGWNL